MLADDGLDGGGDEEILLLQAQGFALVVVIVGVEDLGDDLRHGLLFHRFQILAPGVQGHVHRQRALGVPQAQGVGVLGLVAGDLHVPGDGQDGGVAHVLRVVDPVFVPAVHDLAAEVDLLSFLHLGNQPGVAQAQPVVGQLLLFAVDDLLLEDAQLIADGIAGGGNLQGGHGVQIAGRQTAQAAVAQTGVRLRLKEVGGGEAHGFQNLFQGVQQSQVVGVFFQRAAHEELQGQVVDLTLLLLPHLIAGVHAVAGHDVPQDQGAGLEHVVVVGCLHRTAKVALELAGDHLGQLLLGVFRCIIRHNSSSCSIYLSRERLSHGNLFYQIVGGASTVGKGKNMRWAVFFCAGGEKGPVLPDGALDLYDWEPSS